MSLVPAPAAAASAPGTSAAPLASAPNEGEEDAAKADALALETELQLLEKDETRYKRELRELDDTSRAWTEQLEWMQDRVGGVSAELGKVKLEWEGVQKEDTSAASRELSTLREITPVVTAAFRNAVKSRFGDSEIMTQLSTRKARTTAVFARVYWGAEYADWKVLDTEDGTEVTFEALLTDVARYWGVPAEELVLHHSDGAVWSLDASAASELRAVAEGGSTAKLKVWLKRRPAAQAVAMGGKMAVEWLEDESKMSSAERRRLERQRREKMLGAAKTKSKRMQMEEERKALVNDLIKYVFFISLYMGVLYSRRSVKESYELVQSLRTAFVEENFGDYNEKAFSDIATIEEFYDWAQGPFTEGLLPAELYDGSPVQEQRVMYYNKVVGGVRLRQARVRHDSCEIGASVREEDTPTRGPTAGISRTREYLNWCYDKYSAANADKLPYSAGNSVEGPSDDPLVNAFRWRDAATNQLTGYTVLGQFGLYDGSGYVIDILNLTTDALVETLDFLKEENWLDRGTRGIFVSMVVYNANYNLYALPQFFVELSPAGVMVPKYTMTTIKMDLFIDETTTVATVFEGLLYFYFLYYISIEGTELYSSCRQTGSVASYFNDIWNLMDWSLIIVSFIALAFRMQFFFDPMVRDFYAFTEEYIELSFAARMYELSFSVDSIAAFLALLKLFKFFGLQRNLLILRTTIARAIGDLSVFTIILLVTMFAFAIAGNQIFGQENEEYVDETRAFITLFRMILGDFDFFGIERVDRGAALLYFWVFQILVFFIMVNIFLAILNDAYIAVTEQFAEIDEEQTESLSMAERFRQLRAAFKQRQMDRRIEYLRQLQRKKELAERRAARKVEDAKARTLKSMNMMNATSGDKKGTSSTRALQGDGAELAAVKEAPKQAPPGGGHVKEGNDSSYARLDEDSQQV